MEKYSFPAKIICILGWNGVNFPVMKLNGMIIRKINRPKE